jgi:hypothetical protein
MINAIQGEPTKTSISTYIYLSSLYFIAVGVLYLWGYWAAFKINILEYAGLTDIIKTAAYPIASSFVSVIIGTLLGGIGRDSRNDELNWFQKQLKKWFGLIQTIYVGTLLIVFFFFPEWKWLWLPYLIALPLSLVLAKQRFFGSMMPNDNTRMIIAFLLAALPAIAFGNGRLKAMDIIDGKSYTYSKLPIENIEIPKSIEAGLKLRYLGQADEYIFFYNPNKKSIVVTKFEQIKSLELESFPDNQAIKVQSSEPNGKVRPNE